MRLCRRQPEGTHPDGSSPIRLRSDEPEGLCRRGGLFGAMPHGASSKARVSEGAGGGAGVGFTTCGEERK